MKIGIGLPNQVRDLDPTLVRIDEVSRLPDAVR